MCFKDPTPPYTVVLYGIAERADRYLLEEARVLIYGARLLKHFYGYAVQTAAYVKNLIPNQSIKNFVPFEQVWNVF